MKKIILSLSALFLIITTSSVHADCMYEELEPSCNILWNTITSSCQGWSDTSSWDIPTAYQGECKATETINEASKEIISDFLYELLSKKNYITSETDTYYRLSNEWQEYIQNKLFSAVHSVISKEIKKSSPNYKNIAILNHLVSLVWYDYYMSK
jgi:hypothetical protein